MPRAKRASRRSADGGGGPLRSLSDTTRRRLRHHVHVAIDFEAEGLLDGAEDREPRLELLHTLEGEGFSLDELRAAAAQDRLVLLMVERVIAGDGDLHTPEELAEETGLAPDFLDEA